VAYRFESDEDVREAIRRCAREQLDHAVSELSEWISEDPVTAVHSARKAVKRERSLLRLSRGAMPSKQLRVENRALRGAARGLSRARDAEVMIQTVEELSERFAGQLPQATFAAIGEQLAVVRDQQRARLQGSALSPCAAGELGSVRLRVDDWRIRGNGWRTIEPGLLHSYRRGRQAFATTRRHPSFENLHAWRKRVKDLWYQERLLAPICGPAVKGQAKDAHRLADLLGDDHDLGLLRHILTHDHLDAAVDLDAVVGLIDHRRAELQSDAAHIGERVYAETPKAFRRRMKRSWKAGRATAQAVREHDPAELATVTRVPHHE